jgi:hypothetical protein
LGLAAFAGFVAVPGNRVQAAPVTLDIPLTGAEEVPPVVGYPGSAFARVTFDDATKQLKYAVTVSGVSPGEVTAAHIHRAPAGANGPIVYPLSTTGFTAVEGTINLTDADVADLMAGNFYINVHSLTYPAGFARGQINLSPEPGIRASVNAAIDAWNRKDVAGFTRYWTAAGLIDEFDASSVEEVMEFLPEFIGDPPLSLAGLSNVQRLSSDSARAIVDLKAGLVLERHDYTFVFEGGIWKINGGPIISAPLPAGAARVTVQMKEFAFVYDKNAVASGNFAFQAVNIGKQPHEIALAKIPANADLEFLLETEEDVPGFEFIGHVFALPGETANMVFTQPLSAGRYAMVCFIPDPATDTPHAFLGMVSEFNVGAAPGGGVAVRPPSTGDAGLADEASSSRHYLLAAGLVSVLGALALFATSREARSEA